MILAIHGKASSGKDTVGSIIQYLIKKKEIGLSKKIKDNEYDFNDYLKSEHSKSSSWKIKKFAGKLKEIASILLGIPVEQFELEYIKNQLLPREWQNESNTLTIRLFLQRLGTDAIRDVIHPNTWVNALMSEYKPYCEKLSSDDNVNLLKYHKYPNWIITDTRFFNELRAVKSKMGITIRVNRPLLNETSYEKAYRETHEHESEKSLDNEVFDYYIDNSSTIDDLIVQVKEILIKERIL